MRIAASLHAQFDPWSALWRSDIGEVAGFLDARGDDACVGNRRQYCGVQGRERIPARRASRLDPLVALRED